MSKSDIQLKQDIEEELRCDPQVNAAQVGVVVHQGAVSLVGVVDSYPERWAAAAATKRVGGVRTVAENLSVKVLAGHVRKDSEVAEAVLAALKWNVLVPRGVTAVVQNGHVRLEGQVTWDFQRRAASRAVRHLVGVVSTHNAVTLTARPSVAQVKEMIESALHRQATTDAKSIQVVTSGTKVSLSGHATSFRTINDARDAAWSVPGVDEVDNKITIAPTF